jgi:hypothetical protein
MTKTLLMLLLLVSGCGETYIGRVGNTKFYSIASEKGVGPDFNALVTETDGKAHVEQIFSGPGIVTTLGSTAITVGVPLGAAAIQAEADRQTVNVTSTTSTPSK